MPTPDPHRTFELIARAKAGDREALNELIARYYERVRRIARARLGPKLRSKLESGDILQSVFEHAVTHLAEFEVRNEASWIHWLSQLTEWRIRDERDRMTRGKRDLDREVAIDETAPDVSPAAALPDPGTSPFDAAVTAEDHAAVDACLDEISQDHRELILLRDYEGFTWEEVAHRTGRPSGGAARMAYHRALLELGARLQARRGAEEQ